MSMFSKALEKARPAKPGNTALKQKIIQATLQDAQQQNAGLAELITLFTYMQASNAERRNTDELIRDVKSHLSNANAQYSDEVKQLIDSAMKDPAILSLAVKQSQENAPAVTQQPLEDKTPAATVEEKPPVIPEEQLVDVTTLAKKPDPHADEAFTRRMLSEYPCVHPFFRTERVDMYGNWTFAELDESIFIQLYATFNGKKSGPDEDAKRIHAFLKSVKDQRGL